MTIVRANLTWSFPFWCVRPISGPFEIAVSSGATIIVTSKVALKSGSSNDGKARRQSVAWNWVVAMV